MPLTCARESKLCELMATCPVNPDTPCTRRMERKIFWLCFIGLGLLADFLLPIWWALVATIPIGFASWWIAYRSDWF